MLIILQSFVNLMNLLILRSINIYNIRIDKGIRTIFVPHSAGIYVNINLTSYELDDKYFKCNAILNIESLDNDLKDLL